MHEVTVEREIEAPKAAVWEVLDDFGGVVSYNPGVSSSAIVAGPDTGEGATRECVLEQGGRIEEEIVDYEPEAGYTVEFVEMGDFPLKENVVHISVEALDDSRTVVTMEARYTPKFGPVGWLLAKTVMNSKFEESFEESLDGLASRVEARQQEHDQTVSGTASD